MSKQGVNLWLFNSYFGKIDWFVFGFGQFWGILISGLAFYPIVVNKLLQRKKFEALNDNGVVTNAKFSRFKTYTVTRYSNYTTSTVTHYECSIYFEAKSTNDGLCSVSKHHWSISLNTYNKLRRVGTIKIVYDPNDLLEWCFEIDMIKSLNEPKWTKCMIFTFVIYIIFVIGSIIFCLWLSWEISYDPGNITAPLLVLFTTAIGWPFICHFTHLCNHSEKQKFIIQKILKSKLPDTSGDVTKNNGNTRTKKLETLRQMVELELKSKETTNETSNAVSNAALDATSDEPSPTYHENDNVSSSL